MICNRRYLRNDSMRVNENITEDGLSLYILDSKVFCYDSCQFMLQNKSLFREVLFGIKMLFDVADAFNLLS